MKETSASTPRSDRRKSQGILFDAQTSIRTPELQLYATVIDMSLNGILVKRPDTWSPGDVGQVDIVVELDDRKTQIRMQATLVHKEPDRLGFRCKHIDTDSISHLRRLVELSLKDPDLLERQLHALMHPR